MDMVFGIALLSAPVILAGTALLYVLLRRNGRKKGRPRVRDLMFCALAAYAILVWFATLGLSLLLGQNARPSDWAWWYMLNMRPFDWLSPLWKLGWTAGWAEISTGLVFRQLGLNILMFVPFGVLLPVVFPRLRRLWRTGLTGLALTLAIETTQYFTGRSADIDDVLANFTGALIGYAIYRLLDHLLSQRVWWHQMNGRPVEPSAS